MFRILMLFGILQLVITAVRADDFRHPQSVLKLKDLCASLNTQITDIQEGERGYKWITTLNGLVKYNGIDATVLKSEYPTGKNFIRVLKCSDNQLWFLTFNGGLCKVRNDSIVPYSYNPLFRSFLSSGNVEQYNVETNGDFYFTVKNRGIFKIDSKGALDTIVDSESKKAYGYCLFTTPNGARFAVRLVPKSQDRSAVIRLYSITNSNLDTISELSELNYKNISLNTQLLEVDEDDELLIIGNKKLIRIRNKLVESLSVDYEIREGFKAKDGRIWLSGRLNGVFEAKLNSGGITLYPLKEFQNTFGLLRHQGSNGDLWVVSKNKGIVLIPQINVNFLSFKKSDLGQYSNYTISSFKNQMYCGGEGHLSLVNPTSKEPIVPIDISFDQFGWKYGKWFLSMLSTDSMLWASGYFGIARLRNDDLKQVKSPHFSQFYKYEEHPFGYKTNKIIPTDGKHVFCSSMDMVYTINEDSVVSYVVTERGAVKDIAYLNDSLVFVLLKTGLYRSNPFNLSQQQECIELDSIKLRFIEVIDSKLVLITQEGILIVLDPISLKPLYRPIQFTGEVFSISKQSINQEALYFTGEFGIAKFTVDFNGPRMKYWPIEIPTHETGKGRVFVNNSELFVAVQNGVLHVDLNSIKRVSTTPNFLIEKVFVNEIEFPNISSMDDLKHFENNVFIKTSIFNYQFPNRKVQLRYRINNSNWVHSSERLLNLIGLSPGEYEVEIQTQYQGLPWSNPIALKFEIVPPFWKTWWFLSFILIAVLSTLFGVIWYYFRIKERELQLSLNQALSEQKALRSQLNPHFLFNALNSAIWLINKGKNQEAVSFVEQLAEMFRDILNTSARATSNLKDEFELYQRYLLLARFRLENRFEFNVEIEEGLKVQNTLVPSLILQPLIENAIKHGIQFIENGFVDVLAKKVDGGFVLLVKDNGGGFKEDIHSQKSDSMGLKITLERLNLFEKLYDVRTSLSIVPNEDIGTSAIIEFKFLS
jgi:two-component sensor histidine kinase